MHTRSVAESGVWVRNPYTFRTRTHVRKRERNVNGSILKFEYGYGTETGLFWKTKYGYGT